MDDVGQRSEKGRIRGFFTRKRDRAVERLGEEVADRGDAVREKAEAWKAQTAAAAKEKGEVVAHDTVQLLAALLLAVLAAVFLLLAVLTTVAFLVQALAGPLPTWAAGLIGAALLAAIGAALGLLGKRRIDRMIAVQRKRQPDDERDERAAAPPRRRAPRAPLHQKPVTWPDTERAPAGASLARSAKRERVERSRTGRAD